MATDATYIVELLVGLGCLVGGAATIGGRLRWLGIVLVTAGATAIVHALAQVLA